MSTGFSGADVEQLRALSSRLKAQSGKLREISSSSSAALLAAQWTGNDIDAIRDNWKQRSLPRLTGLADSLHQMGAELDRQALEQERASGATSGSADFSLGTFSAAMAGMIAGIVGALPGSLAPGESSQSTSPSESTTPQSGAVAQQQPDGKGREGSTEPGKLDAGQQRNGYAADMGEPPYPIYRGTSDGNGAFKGECTSWAAWRRKELGLPWRETPGSGTGAGGEMARRMDGSTSTPPSLGAIVSDPAEGHVMIVEEIYEDGSFRVSEMNIGGQASSFRDTSIWKPEGNGSYSRGAGQWFTGPRQLVIAP